MPEQDRRSYPTRADAVADHIVAFRLTDQEVLDLDRRRGSLSRSEYLRRCALAPVEPSAS